MKQFIFITFLFLCSVLNSQTAQLRSVDCYRTNVGLTQALYANPTGAIGYRFELTNIQLNQTVILDKTVRSMTISEFPTISRYNCNYKVRVAINTGSGFGAFGPICSINSAPLISTLRSVDCPKNLLAINSPVYSNIHIDAYPNTDFWDFEVRMASDTTISEQLLNRPSREFRLTMASAMFQLSATHYQVRVRTSQSGILQPWGTWCSIFSPADGPPIIWGCGQTLEYLAYQHIKCDTISNATQYEFMLRTGSNLVSIKSTTVDSIRIDYFVDANNYPLYNYGSTYRIAARAYANGAWTAWGSLCYFSITQSPHTEVQHDCGQTLASFNTPVPFFAVSNAIYEFEVTDLTTGSYNDGVQTKIKSSGSDIRRIKLNELAQWSWGHQYSYRCRLKFKGVQYDWSQSCVINAPEPIAYLRGPDCPKTLTSSGQAVYSRIMTQDQPLETTAYQFRIGTSESVWKMGIYGRQITLQEILGTQPSLNTTYPIQVRVMHEGTPSNWGYTCLVTTPMAIMIDSNDFEINYQYDFSEKLVIYPNPFDSKFEVISDKNYTICIVDITGKIVEVISPDKKQGGEYLPQGIYYAIIEDKIYKIFKN
jgi:hypothetical protein